MPFLAGDEKCQDIDSSESPLYWGGGGDAGQHLTAIYRPLRDS
jgi:hypothetical protein